MKYYQIKIILSLITVLLFVPSIIQAKILNPSFEDGSNNWHCSGEDCPLWIVDYQKFAVTGTHYVALFGATTMYQDITLPTKADRLGLLFHYWLNGQVNSKVKVKIIDKKTDEIYLNKTIDEVFVGSMKTQSFLLPETALGQKVRVQFISTGEVYLDSITIERKIAYPVMRAYIVSWTGENDLTGARVKVFTAEGEQLRLKNIKTGISAKSIVTNEQNTTPLFKILGVRRNNESFSLCANKGDINKCTEIEPPMGGEDYSINFSPDYSE